MTRLPNQAHRLVKTPDHAGAPGHDVVYGNGIIDPLPAVTGT